MFYLRDIFHISSRVIKHVTNNADECEIDMHLIFHSKKITLMFLSEQYEKIIDIGMSQLL